MRILYLNYEFPPIGGGGSYASYEMAKELTRNHEIDVITMKFGNLKKIEKKENMTIYRINSFRGKKEICRPIEMLIYLFSAFFLCRTLIKQKKYDLIINHFIIPTGILALLLHKCYNLKYIVVSHGSDILGYNPRFKWLYLPLKNLWISIIKNSVKTIVPSYFLKEKLIENYKTEKVIVIPLGIDPTKFNPLPKKKQILLVSRLFKNKGVQDFLEAIKNIDLKEWKIVIVGDGPYTETIQKMVREYRLDNIELKGWIDNNHPEFKRLYGESAIFILSSHFESFGLVLLEALASGCFIISSEVGAAKEIVKEGIIYQPGNIEQLRTGLIKAILDYPKIVQKGIKISQNAENYAWENIIKNYELLIKTTIIDDNHNY